MRIKKIGGIAGRGQKLKGREWKRRRGHMVGRLVDVVKDEIRFTTPTFGNFTGVHFNPNCIALVGGYSDYILAQAKRKLGQISLLRFLPPLSKYGKITPQKYRTHRGERSKRSKAHGAK